ncbi:hypothetical protein ACWGOQ_0021080 [Aquimarina sp. M1]
MNIWVNPEGVITQSRDAQITIQDEDHIEDSCSDWCSGTTEGNIFIGQCTCITKG